MHVALVSRIGFIPKTSNSGSSDRDTATDRFRAVALYKLLPGAPVYRQREFTPAEITAYDRDVPRYFLADVAGRCKLPALFWIKGDPMRIAASKEDVPRVVDRVHDRIAACWAAMDKQINPGRYVLGDELSVLDLYVTVVSRFGPWRTRFYKTAPKMAEIVKRVDAKTRSKTSINELLRD